LPDVLNAHAVPLLAQYPAHAAAYSHIIIIIIIMRSYT